MYLSAKQHLHYLTLVEWFLSFRGETGNKTFRYFRTISRGVLEYEGIEVREVEAEYSWRKVTNECWRLRYIYLLLGMLCDTYIVSDLASID